MTPSASGASVAFVSRLFVHPVKGMAALPVQRLELDEIGPLGDRRWMVVKDGGEFVTQRGHPALALVQALPLEGERGVLLRAPGAGFLEVLEPGSDAPRIAVSLWNDRVEAALAVEDAHRWLSDVLGAPVRLVRLPDTVPRRVGPEGRRLEGFPGRVAFSDAYPLLVLGEASVEDVDRRVPGETRIGVERFRPNVVVGGTGEWEEDRWRRIRIGEVELALVKPCPRCVVTTVDPTTAEKGDEPLATLARFRRQDGKIWVGQNALHRSPGVLHVGDPVEVLEIGEARPGPGLQKQWG